jgi:hypothetical protein
MGFSLESPYDGKPMLKESSSNPQVGRILALAPSPLSFFVVTVPAQECRNYGGHLAASQYSGLD